MANIIEISDFSVPELDAFARLTEALSETWATLGLPQAGTVFVEAAE